LVRTLALFLLAVLALLTFTLHRASGRVAATPGDLRLSTIASELAQRKVTIRCEGSGTLLRRDGESGRTLFVNGKPGNTSFLQAGVCTTLHRYSRELKAGYDCLLPCTAPLEVAWALNTLAHESYHLAGVRNEAETECSALQAIDFTARRLGATSVQARAHATFAFRELPDRMPALYSSPECRDGGRYDLRPASILWP
jgi:hypothetical protein